MHKAQRFRSRRMSKVALKEQLRRPRPQLREHFRRDKKFKVIAVTPIHEPDARRFLPQLLSEFLRLDWGVVWHINNIWNPDLLDQIQGFRNTVGWTETNQTNYRKSDGWRALELAQLAEPEWVVPHDADETWEPNAPKLLEKLLNHRALYVVPWYNIWAQTDGELLIRMDKPYLGVRPRLYPVGPWRWEYRNTLTASPYCCQCNNSLQTLSTGSVRVLHWGFSTQDLREYHHALWNNNKAEDSDYWSWMMEKPPLLKPFDPDCIHENFHHTDHEEIRLILRKTPGTGWLNFDEAWLLYRTAEQTRGPILEVGSYHGKSTVLLAHLGRPIYSVDPFLGFDKGDPTGDKTARAFYRNIRPYHRLIEHSRKRVEDWTPQPCGYAYLDGDHSYEGTVAQIKTALECGVSRIAVHDYNDHGGGLKVKQACVELLGKPYDRRSKMAVFIVPPKEEEA